MSRRLLLSLAAVLMCLVPAISAPFGGNDSGVWILPRATPLSGGLPSYLVGYSGSSLTTGSSLAAGASLSASSARMTIPVVNFNDPLRMRVTGMRLPPITSIQDVVSGRTIPVRVMGGDVSFSARTLQALGSLPSGVASGVITDTSGRGYMVVIRTESAGSRLTIEIY